MCSLLLAMILGWLGICSGPGRALGQAFGPKSPLLSPALAAMDRTADGPNASATNTTGGVAQKLAQARVDLAVASQEAGLTNLPAGASAEELALRRGLLQRLVRLYEKQQGEAQELETAREGKGQSLRQAQAWEGFAEPRPYSILLADGLREEIQSVRLQASIAEAAVKLSSQVSDAMKDSLAQAEEEIRRLNEQLEGSKDRAAVAALTRTRDLRRLQSQVALAGSTTADTEYQVNRERLEASRARLSLLQRQLVIARAGMNFTQADLDRVVESMETERLALERELAAVEAQAALRDKALAAARQQIQRLQPPPLPREPDPEKAPALELVELRQTQAETALTAADVLRTMLEAGNIQRTMWELRYAAYGSHSVATLQNSQSRLETFFRRLRLWKDYYRQRLQGASSEADARQGRLLRLGSDSPLGSAGHEWLESLREREEVLLRGCRTIDRLERLAMRLDEDLQDSLHRLPVLARVRSVFSRAGSFVNKLWQFELFTAEDTIVVDGQPITGRRSITLGKVIKALVILALGFWFSGLASRLVESLAIKRLKVDTNQARLIRGWARAALVMVLILVSLTWVKIPLTVFAFAGGALAIGLGFGTQTLLKNFISGIIILSERPFRVGHVLEVDGQHGKVTGIGFRSSVLQLWDGTEVLIPNSELLERKLTNWTFSNRLVRFTISVGVAYGTDTRRVINLLHEVAQRHGLVQKDPKPQAFLTGFQDSTLGFELRFWVDVQTHNAAEISSDLRQMIVGTFTEQGIVIAFPQLDLHLDARDPVPAQLLTRSEIQAQEKKGLPG